MNPANNKFNCGAECGLATVGTASAGVEHWSTVNGSPSVVTSGPSPMRSTRCFRFNPSAAAAGLTHTLSTSIASGGTGVARVYVYFATLPSASAAICYFQTGASIAMGVFFDSSDSTLRAGRTTANLAASGAAVTTGQWYRVEFKSVASASPTVDLTVDGVAQAQYSFSAAASTIPTFVLGAGASTFTADYYIDDVVVSETSGDYPIGPGVTVGLYPNGDRTNSAASPTDGNAGHLFSATTDFGKGTSGGTATGAQNVEATSWQSLDNPLTTTAGGSWIADLLGTNTEHLVWSKDAMPAAATVQTINALAVVLTTHSASATTNQIAFRLVRPNGNNSLLLQNDLSETTIAVAYLLVTSAPSGGDITTVSGVDELNFRFGDSNDVNPDVYLDGCCMEVDYTPVDVPLIARASPYPQMIGR